MFHLLGNALAAASLLTLSSIIEGFKGQMESILTPEAIPELDTFTLEQKIEELEASPNRALYLSLLQMAKVELIERLDIEEFGRQLANDQYKLDLEFELPPLQLPPLYSLKPSNKKEQSAHIQMQMGPGRGFLTIGKPAVSHHYQPKPKPKAKETVKSKAFLKAKKSTPFRQKQSRIGSLRSSLASTGSVLVKGNPVREVVKKVELRSVSQDDPKNVPVPVAKQEVSLRDKLRREVRQMEGCFRQNDAYDDMKGIKLQPLNLKQEEEKMLQQQTTQKVRLQQQGGSKTLGVLGQYTEANTSIPEQIEFLKTEPPEILQQLNNPQIQIEDFNHEEPTVKEQIKEPGNTQQSTKMTPFITKHQNIISIAKPGSQLCPTHVKIQDIETEKEKEKEQSIGRIEVIANPSQQPHVDNSGRQLKSKSLKNFNTRVLTKNKEEHQEFELLTAKLQPNITPDIKAIQPKQSFTSQQSKVGIKILKPKQEPLRFLGELQGSSFPYCQLVPSFQRLFPNSKNLLVTLRNVEEDLKLHFSKEVTAKSIAEDMRRLSTESDLQFRVIFESEKAKKHHELFHMSLDNYYQRSGVMLERAKGQLEEPQPWAMKFYRVVRTREQVYDIVSSSFHRTADWWQLPHGLQLRNSWNLLWTWSRPQIDFCDLLLFQKVNHFLGNKQIARKDLLKKNIEKAQRVNQKMRTYFDIIPETFLLPGENIAFIRAFRQQAQRDPLNYWILKPVGLSRGRGIEVISKLEEVVFAEPVILQRYVSNPLLLDGFKFDMRIYVLVTSINPLEAFIYKEGFARLSTQPYSLHPDQKDNKLIHLTNFSIQRENLTQDGKTTSIQQQLGGSKISLRMLAARLQKMGLEWSSVWSQIEEIVLKSLVACMNVIPVNPNCFQLFGYDIFMDAGGRCWLLQVNSSPSLEKEFMLDQVIKQTLLDDIVQVLDPPNYDRARLLEVIVRRRKEAEGLKSAVSHSNNSQQQLNVDLGYILRGRGLRRYGEDPVGTNFKMLAPSDLYRRIVRFLQHFKMDPIVKDPV